MLNATLLRSPADIIPLERPPSQRQAVQILQAIVIEMPLADARRALLGILAGYSPSVAILAASTPAQTSPK